ncbi:MAG TPA: signal peptidase I [Hadesarchaea archaeon]|nr:signal peptidase I [Hadesarchaea archaeon]
MIFVMLVLLMISGFGWLNSFRASLLNNENIPSIPYDNTYSWTEVFHGYEAYLDRRISYSVVSGPSMEPTFGDGDAVMWVEVNPAELRVGDIIVFQHPTRSEEGLWTHRIIGITTNGGSQFETKGDNRAESDAETPISAFYVTEKYLRGFVIGVVYNAGPS